LGSATLEPRIMRVLLALVDARGGVLNRDDLTDLCWDGLIVGEDAVNRAISAIRRLASSVGAEFSVETIPKVGYRIPVVPGAPDKNSDEPPPPVAAGWSRRRVAVGLAALTSASVAGGWLLLQPRADPRVSALKLRAQQSLRDGLPDSAEQGIGFLREAVALAPEDAEAWGLLALALRNAVEEGPPDETGGLVGQCESAAGRALALNAAEPNALAARAALLPAYGDWLAAEARLRAVLAIAPAHAWTLAELGYLLESVGRSRESAQITAQACAIEPLSPVYQYRLAYKKWIIGRPVEADQVIDRAIELWPRHPAVLMARFLLFVWTGRYIPAFDFLGRDGLRFMPPRAIALWQPTIAGLRAIGSTASRDAARLQVEAAKMSPGMSVLAIQLLTLLGDLDAAFEVASGYLLRRGRRMSSLQSAPEEVAVNDQRWRKTVMLFVPTTAALRSDPRFETLVQAIGLESYWRRRGIQPDYRRS
jgi:tetratricopeptide (TPR) repeat protein